MGLVFQAANRNKEARLSYLGALRNNAQYDECRITLAKLLVDIREFDEACIHFEQLRQHNPLKLSYIDAYAKCQLAANDAEAAVALLNEALQLAPNNEHVHLNLGVATQQAGNLPKAKTHFECAIEIRPTFTTAYLNLANLLLQERRIKPAIAQFEDALRIGDVTAQGHCDYASALILDQNFTAGWQQFEWRLQTPLQASRLESMAADRQRWPHSQTDATSDVLIYGEQGVGDEVMFASCIDDFITVSNTAIVLECDTRLQPLFQRSFQNIRVIERDTSPPILEHITEYLPIGSLPLFVRQTKTDFVTTKPYLIADENDQCKWAERFSVLPNTLNIGLSWRGGKSNVPLQKSIPLQQLEPLFTQGVNVINMQYGDHQHEVETFNAQTGCILHDWNDVDPLIDIDDQAAQLSQLDLFISVDNSTAHLAGALGVKTLLLLPYNADWRWMQNDTSTLWYPTVTLSRQRQRDSWADGIQASIQLISTLSGST